MRTSWQKNGKRPVTILRYACMVGSAFAGLVFVLMLVGLYAEWVREHFFSAALCFVSLLFAFFAFISFYVAWSIWWDSFSGCPQSIIAELQTHDYRSLQFFNIAALYFQRRLRSIWICSLFSLFLAIISVPIFFWSLAPLWVRTIVVIAGFYAAYKCRTPYSVSLHGLRLITAARKLDQNHQLDCLKVLATNVGTFRGDPVATHILRLLKDEKTGC